MGPESSDHTPGKPPDSLVAALGRLLRPLVKLLISRGITYQYVTRMLKSVYVEVAENEFRLVDRPLSDSRISLLTGVHRKDIPRLRGRMPDVPETPDNVAVGTRLLSVWLDDSRYTDAAGQPLDLPLRESDPGAVSFESLVDRVSGHDLRARVVLDELTRLGIVSVQDDRRVRLEVDGFVPDSGFDEKAWYFGENIRAHMAAGAHNLAGGDPTLFERSVSYGKLTENDIDQLAGQIRGLGNDALKQISHDARELQQGRTETARGRDRRFTFGIYFHEGKDEDE